MRAKLFLSLAMALFFVGAESIFAAEPDLSFSDAVDHIEKSYRFGMESAADAEERLEYLRLRNRSLELLADLVYQSMLPWLLDRPELVVVLQDDQTLWRNELRAIQATAHKPGVGSGPDLEREGELILARLRAFSAISGQPGLALALSQ